MNNKQEYSLQDTKELKKLILENQELPLIIFVDESIGCGGYYYTQGYVQSAEIKTLGLYKDNIWLEEEAYAGKLASDMDSSKDWPDEEFSKELNKELKKVNFIKAIVVCVGGE